MEDKIVEDLIVLCHTIDEIASKIYYEFSSKTKNKDLKNFWFEMYEEEKTHISFWDEMLDMSKKHFITQIFDNPEEIKKDLEDIKLKISILLEKASKMRRKSDIFVSALRMEFYLLHPAFYTFIQFFKILQPEKPARINYESHLNKIIETLKNYREETLDLDLFGEVLNNLLKENRKLVVLSNIDFLTKIFNRRGFYKAINPFIFLAQRSNYNVAMMMIDVDNFKRVNDIYGHKAGDDILKMISDAIKKNVRRSDIIGRYGGEEFLVFFPHVSSNAICKLGDKIRQNIEKDSSKNIPVTVSIGISQKVINGIPENELDLLIKKADEAMYEAKRQGKNKVVVYNL